MPLFIMFRIGHRRTTEPFSASISCFTKAVVAILVESSPVAAVVAVVSSIVPPEATSIPEPFRSFNSLESER